jgi:hypothetical protein
MRVNPSRGRWSARGRLLAVTLATACGHSSGADSSSASSDPSHPSPDFSVAGSVAVVHQASSDMTVNVVLTSAPLPLGCATTCLSGTAILLNMTGFDYTDASVALAPGTYTTTFPAQTDGAPYLEVYAALTSFRDGAVLATEDAVQATITLSAVTSASVTGSYDLTFPSGSVQGAFDAQNCGTGSDVAACGVGGDL